MGKTSCRQTAAAVIRVVAEMDGEDAVLRVVPEWRYDGRTNSHGERVEDVKPLSARVMRLSESGDDWFEVGDELLDIGILMVQAQASCQGRWCYVEGVQTLAPRMAGAVEMLVRYVAGELQFTLTGGDVTEVWQCRLWE